ncbi:MAG: exodeoxyribonuclease VII large subunit [Lentisphaeria bacterium]|nr:exodeoxyribonuclease VII large subunit [Lentisphaeria bacterium]
MENSTGETKEKIFSVSELNGIVREVLEGSLLPFWVSGEVGNLTIHRSGHVYMTLKDSSSQIKAVFFSGAQQCLKLGLKEGMQIEAYGKLSVYMARGEYQLAVRSLRPVGIGDLQKEFEELKKRLAAEGLFDPARKKPMPFLPTRIGLVTSADGAALHDFLKISLNRFPTLEIRIFPAMVQGKGAEKTLASGVNFFNKRIGYADEVDVIVVTRGGGSLEDLWPFNEEVLARAIAASTIPVVSAVGHEIDFTISDFAADLRAPTPSGAAEILVPEKDALMETIKNLDRRGANAITLLYQQAKSSLDTLLSSPALEEPAYFVMEKSRYVDDLESRLALLLDRKMEYEKSVLERQKEKLSVLSPYNVLKRGYALLTDEKGHPVTSAEKVSPGEILTGRLAQGELSLLVTEDGKTPPGRTASMKKNSVKKKKSLSGDDKSSDDGFLPLFS